MILKQSTAVDVLIGPFVDIADGATSEAGETPTVKLSKNGQALGAKSDVTVPVYDADGYYNCELDATDTDGVGTLVLIVAASATALPVRHEYQVVEEAVYAAYYATSSPAPVVATDIVSGGAINTTTGAVDTVTTNTDMVSAAPSAGTNAAAVWDLDATSHQTTGTFGQAIGDPAANTKTLYAALVTDATGASVTADVQAVQTDLDNGTDGLGATKTAVDAIQTDLDNATDGLGALKILIDAVKAETALIVADTGELQSDDYPTTIAALQTDLDTLTAGVALTAASIDAIWDETLTAHVTADSAAVHLKDILADTNELQVDDIPGTLATIAAYVDTEVAAIKAKTDSLTFGVAGVVDANAKYINSAAVVGDGNATPWDGA